MHGRAAGTTPYEIARDRGRFDVERIVGAAAVASRRDPKDVARLRGLLRDGDSAVRYWGATGLAALGDNSRPAEAALTGALADASPSVRIAAAEALSAMGRPKKALPVLAAALRDQSEFVRMHAMNVVDALGDPARSLLPESKRAAAGERE